MNQTVRQRARLVEIVQPINGIQDYAYIPPEKRKPMATRNNDHGLILVASIALVVLIILLAIAG